MIEKIEELKSRMLVKTESNKILKGIYELIDYVEQEHKENPDLFLTKRGNSMESVINSLLESFKLNEYEEWLIPDHKAFKNYLKGNIRAWSNWEWYNQRFYDVPEKEALEVKENIEGDYK